jgi:hypothetical protein
VTPELLARFERALASGALVELVGELRTEGHEILACYRFLYGAFQTHLRAARRPEEVAALLAACETVQHALGATFDPMLFARIDASLRTRALHALVVELHDREGWSKRRLYDTLLAFSFALDAAGRGDETHVVDDELDVISGWCAASAQLWPDEPMD